MTSSRFFLFKEITMTHSRHTRSQLTFDFGTVAGAAFCSSNDRPVNGVTPVGDRLDASTVPTPPAPELEPAPLWSIALDHWLATQVDRTSVPDAPAPVKRRRTRTRTVGTAA